MCCAGRAARPARLSWAHWDGGARDWVICRQFSLVARLMAIRFAARSAIASVLRYAQSQPSSWLARQLVEMPRQGVPLPSTWGFGSGAPRATVAEWRRFALLPALRVTSAQAYRDELALSSSLLRFASWVPGPLLHLWVHHPRVPAADAREWTLARCGHHPFKAGRVSQHRGQGHGGC